MSENLYRKKIIYDDGLIFHVINTNGKTYFSLSNEHRKLGLDLLEMVGSHFVHDPTDNDLYSVECFLEDIKQGIKIINGGHFDYTYSKETIEQAKNDLIDMKEKLERENENIFILYSL